MASELSIEGQAGRDAGGSLASGEEANDTTIYSLVSICLWQLGHFSKVYTMAQALRSLKK